MRLGLPSMSRFQPRSLPDEPESGIALQERENTPPRILGCVRELLLLAVEEAVRRSVVDDDLVLDARFAERLVELRIVLRSDVPVVSGLQREDRALDVGHT